MQRELARLGWNEQPLNTGRHDERHLSSPDSPPPAGTGESRAQVSDSGEWERQADEEASASRRDDAGAAPDAAGPGTGAGGGEAPRVGGS